jgi:Flp pilus assembly protein TadD
MNAPSPTAAERLRRLAAYVELDPCNAALLAEASDAALACGEHEQAEAYLAAGERSAPDSLDWASRRAHLCIARGELQRAQALLEQLRTDSAEHPGVLHDLAYVNLLLGEPGTAQALLAPCIDQDLPSHLADPVQALWLRACHRQGSTAEAWAWIQGKRDGELQAETAGVASLIAWDEDEFCAAARLAQAALSRRPAQREALVTCGLIALAARDPARAMPPLRQALDSNPDDGRTLTALGVACLLAGDALQAELHLRKAADVAPPQAQTLQALGWARMLVDDRAGALDALRSALAVDDQAADVHASLALLLFVNGEGDNARSHLERAEKIDATDETTRMARTLLAGDTDMAGRNRLLRELLAQWSPRA